jgi:membrane-associated HD superfamily phosphohydrolase
MKKWKRMEKKKKKKRKEIEKKRSRRKYKNVMLFLFYIYFLLVGLNEIVGLYFTLKNIRICRPTCISSHTNILIACQWTKYCICITYVKCYFDTAMWNNTYKLMIRSVWTFVENVYMLANNISYHWDEVRCTQMISK